MATSGVTASFMQFLFSGVFGLRMAGVFKAKMAVILAGRIGNW